ncbi:uncharacterized protein LOC133837479 isoform X1 [Drosophila sulfurigaster albostrigata]|uniref:uncharacterized protein LOC133837479 isoform X1 n=1 Tax=Drosophila sulfurigaster albostrigata TaxID=89887 RepID=UPI002D2192AB|nr:uncharacterized protein LOC133837479 isoform X1 [Drosophila sulfurigaster albostrigata]XP_062124251.1 uncharacterized protein LOC133837479 isoform X1 [Drosophila sulfurigaster albostrigata]XP_062124258.1 uncharacterized protein LOC133837479 isoform X1 [Drosophila sulfurigaster albostrigata]
MDSLGISTEPSFLEVELPQTLLESPSVSTFLPDEEASICPLLSSNNTLGTGLLSHPLSPNIAASDITSSNISNTDCKAETSSSGSSTGIAMDAMDTSTNLFNKVNYHHLQNNNMTINQESSTHCLKGNRRKSKETPSFVSWNWPLIRKCTFFVFISGVLAMCSIVVAQIASLPKYCNPKTEWYQGGVFYEINPTSFKDTNNDGIGDIRGLINGIEYFANLGISGVRLNSIFPTGESSSLRDMRPELGHLMDLKIFAHELNARNMSLLLDLPLQQIVANSDQHELIETVGAALNHWIHQGVNGFYLKGLVSIEKLAKLSNCLDAWKSIVGPDRVLMVEESLLKHTAKTNLTALLEHVDLVDVVVDVESDTQKMKQRIESVLAEMPAGDDSTWIHWSIGEHDLDVDNNPRKIYAATLMQLTLPGTPNIMHSNQIAIAQTNNNESNQTEQFLDDWTQELHNLIDQMDFKASHGLVMIKNMIALRHRSPSIYKNFVCKANKNKSNTQILANSNAKILVIVRNYPRKFSFVSVTNFGDSKAVLDLTSNFYSGNRMLSATSEKIYFEKIKIDSFDTIVVKLDK